MWPLPALGAWACAWALYLSLASFGAPLAIVLLLPTLLGAALGLLSERRWRRVFVALGFPLSLIASGAAGSLPAWAWLLPLAALLAMYPVHAWRDAPMFPTPVGALDGLNRLVALDGPSPRVLDAGCGLGDGLRELHSQYPNAQLDGIEWSWPLRLMCALRCRWLKLPVRVSRGDIWMADWSGYEIVYLFQRPESMPRAADKAAQELHAGAWLASLEFEAPDLRPNAVLACADGRKLWLYRAPFEPCLPTSSRSASPK
jgi:SAM-dependent methyltransferase